MAPVTLFELAVPAEEYRSSLNSWVRSMTKTERRDFDAVVGFRCMFGWTGLRVNWDMLRAVARFWSPDSHLFHFSYNEMCPTHEEFCAMTGFPEGRTIAVPSFTRTSTSALQELLGLDLQECQRMIRKSRELGHFVDLTMLPSLFAAPASSPSATRRRQGALALCLFAKYFFVSYEGLIDARVPDLILQAMDGVFNIIPLILAESLHGLDQLAAGADSFGSGSPLLIHMWVQEHFNQIPPPAEGRYEPSMYSTRGRRSHSPRDETEWISFFAQAISCEISWTIPHWRVRRFVPHSCGYSVVVLPGLRFSSFYWAIRILRQFGWEQVIPGHEELVMTVEKIDGSLARHIQTIWQHNIQDRSIANPDSPMSTLLSLEYIEWIASKAEDHSIIVSTMVEQLTGLSLTSGIHSRLWEIGIDPEKAQLDCQRRKARHGSRGSSRPRDKRVGKSNEESSGSSGKKKSVFSRLGF